METKRETWPFLLNIIMFAFGWYFLSLREMGLKEKELFIDILQQMAIWSCQLVIFCSFVGYFYTLWRNGRE